LKRAEERKEHAVEEARAELAPRLEEFEKLVQSKDDDRENFARLRTEAVNEAGIEYEATVRKLKDSHEDELAALKETHETLVNALRDERKGEEDKLRSLIGALSADLRAAEEAIEAERTLRQNAERLSASDMEARRVAETERAREQRFRQMAEDLVAESQRARDAAERRTKEQYLEIERAKHAYAKRKEQHGKLSRPPSAATAEGDARRDEAIAALPKALGLELTDKREEHVAECRAKLNDATSHYKASIADLKRAKEEAAESHVLGSLATRSKQKREDLAAAADAFGRALDDWARQKEKELQKIKDEKSTVGSALNDHESPSSKSRSRIEYDD
jgi:hypothetical protein